MMSGLRDNAAAGLIAVFGILLIWLGFSGRLGVVLGAILCPAQLQKATADGTPQPADDAAAAAIEQQIAAIVQAQAAQAGAALQSLFINNGGVPGAAGGGGGSNLK